MPKMTCNGFSMYAQSERAKLETEQGVAFRSLKDLMVAVTPIWNNLPIQEKMFWKQKAKEYRSSEEFKEMGKPRRKSRPRRRPRQEVDEDEDDDEDDEMIDLPLGPFIRWTHNQTYTQPQHEVTLDRAPITPEYSIHLKSVIDATRLLDFFTQNGGHIQDVKRSRFLLATVQTYGDLHKDLCIPAELCLTEFSLEEGLLEDYCVIFGPWQIHDQQLRARAEFIARESHKIGLEGCPPDYKETAPTETELIHELLGRTQPIIQMTNHTKAAGLYADGLATVTPAGTVRNVCDGVDLLLPGDPIGHRYIVCFSSQYHYLISVMNFLKKLMRVEEEGWPLDKDRYILLDGLVDACSSFVCQTLSPQTRHSLAVLQDPARLPKKGEVTDLGEACSYHSDMGEYRFCAQAQGRRAISCVVDALSDALSDAHSTTDVH